MKKKMAGLVMLAMIATFSTFANNGDETTINEKVKSAFDKAFVQAREVQWSKSGLYFVANFTMHGQVMDAYYSAEGELVAQRRNLLSTQLPLTLFTALTNKYNKYWITNLFEYGGEDGTTYYATLENADQVITVKSVNMASWELLQKTKKD